MKKFNRPAEPVSDDDLACRYSHVTTGQVLAATFRSIAKFGAHQLDLPDIAQISNRVSDAQYHALVLCAIRGDTNGLPLYPAVMTKECGNGAPLPGRGRRQGERFRLDTARCAQREQAMPAC